MRDNNLEVSHVREVYDVLSSGALTLDNAAYAANDYLHTGVITFANAFLEQTDCLIEVIGIRATENITTGTLAKPGFKLVLFDECDIVPTANNAFSFANGTNTTIDNIKGTITVANPDWDSYKNASNTYDAVVWGEPAKKIIFKVGSTNRYIKGIALATGTPTFDNTATVNIDLIVRVL